MARYTDSLLVEGEHVLYRTRQHPLGRITGAKWGILMVGIAIALLLAIFIANVGGTARDLLGWLTLALLVVGALNIIWVYLRWWAEDYAVTNRRILKVEGLFNKRSADSSLEKINDAILEQSVFGRMFDWGNLKVLTAAEETADDYLMLHHAPTFKKTMLLAKQDLEDELARRITAPLEALNAHEVEQDRRADAAAAASQAAAPVAAPVAAPAAPPVAAPKTTEEKLRELAALRDAGLITPEDFEAKKTAILATM
jgi:uncharacterized membrane protein YdbT with pleckstrin-like domain